MEQLSSRPQILLVVQHQDLRTLISAQLLEDGHRVKSLATLEEALAVLRTGRRPPSVLILDTLHQQLTLEAMDSLPAEIPLLVCSGPLDQGGPLLSQRPQTTLLQKPFTIRELVDAVHKLCYK